MGYNPHYEKGVRFERKIVNEARREGNIAFRSAGSHSPIDVCIINKESKTIYFYQCKNTISSQKKLKESFNNIEDNYKVIWKVLEN